PPPPGRHPLSLHDALPILRPVPIQLALALARGGEIVCGALPTRPEPRLTTYGVATLAYTQTFDLTRARNVLGYKPARDAIATAQDRKSTRLNSSHVKISYA